MRTIANGCAIGCAILGLLASNAAFAQDDDELYARNGVYVLLQGHYFSEKFDIPEFDAVGIEADGGFGASGHFGYRFHPRWAAELQIDWIHKFEFDNGQELRESEAEVRWELQPAQIQSPTREVPITGYTCAVTINSAHVSTEDELAEAWFRILRWIRDTLLGAEIEMPGRPIWE